MKKIELSLIKYSYGKFYVKSSSERLQETDLSEYAKLENLSSVATSGDYTDLSNKPTIPTVPTNVSAFNNDAGYLTEHQDISGKANTTDLVGVAYFSDDSGEGIVSSDGIYVETINSSASISVNPDVLTMINGSVGTSTITFQVPLDNLAHVWDILMTTDSSVAITLAMSNSKTILYPDGFAIGASKNVEISVIGVGTKYYLRYGEFA